MDFSILEPLFKLHEEVHGLVTNSAAKSEQALGDVLQRVAQHREHALAALAKAKAGKPIIHDILRAAAAPLPPITAREAVVSSVPAPKARRAPSKSVKKPKPK